MAIRFSLYYHSKENGEYLQKIINSSHQGMLVDTQSLANLPAKVNSGTDVIFLEYQEDDNKLDRWIEKTAADPQSPSIFLFLHEITTNSLWKALRLGVKECFTFPVRLEEFQEALERLPRLDNTLDLMENTRVVSCLGSKGGVGNTFLTTNMAYLLAQENKGQVLLIDLDLRYGQTIYFFDAQPKYTIIDVIENFERIDSAYLQSLFHPFDKYLSILPAPSRLEEAEAVKPEHLEKIIRYLRNLRLFRWIILDCCHQMDEVTLKGLELSDDILLVTSPSIPALSNAKKLLELLHLLDLGGVRSEIILNSWQKRGDLAESEVVAFLGREIAGKITFDPQLVGRSINEGRPLGEMAPRHPVCQDLRTIAGRLMGDDNSRGNGYGLGWIKRLVRKD
ncbi:MAG: AAA family ATPase [Syntrophales bacterium]|nr:AAA family ATPase [Syntrophales bacterium]